jgi:hypothetical protein
MEGMGGMGEFCGAWNVDGRREKLTVAGGIAAVVAIVANKLDFFAQM